VVEDAVHGGTGEKGITEERRPLRDAAVGHHGHRAALVVLADDRVEVDRLFVAQRTQTEIVDARCGVVKRSIAKCGGKSSTRNRWRKAHARGDGT